VEDVLPLEPVLQLAERRPGQEPRGEGRGELETILAAGAFAAYILWLDRPAFRGNSVVRFTLVNFAVQSLAMIPLAIATAHSPSDLIDAYASPTPLALLGVLIVACTLGGYGIMSRFQRDVTPTEAGLIYCLEPVFVAAIALFMPAWLSRWCGVEYADETLTWSLLAGGGLIVAANVLIALAPPPKRAEEAGAGTTAEPIEARPVGSEHER
jgi:drug/metabolite transporter (DMT)-like permease